MTDEERSFNYNDLNLDFLELSPPRAKLVRNVTPIPNNSSFRPSAFKAKQLAQRVAHNDGLVNKIEILKKENFELQQKLKDFKNSATQIQELYEQEKQRSNDLQIKHDAETLKSNELQTRCSQLNHDIAEKRLQLEQLEAQLDEAKGPLSYIELAIKYLKLVQKINDENLKHLLPRDKSLFSELSKYCEDKGYKVPTVQASRRKRVYKRDRDIQCNLLEAANSRSSKETQTVSTQTVATQPCQMQTQTNLPTGRDVHTQTLEIATYSSKNVQTKGVQTTVIQLSTQGTQHISTTTTRGTSTSCFIKKHNVGTSFPEPTLVPPITAMVDELLQLYNVSPLSPISDPLPLTSLNELELSTMPAAAIEPLTYKSIGTCTYLCNVQRQIDFIPLISNIKRSQSSSPSPFTFYNVKNEAYATPTPSPPPPELHTATSQNRNDTEVRTATNHFGNMRPLLNTAAQLPDMQPETFSTVWQMAGQMFMGLLYPPTNNHMRIASINRAENSLNQEQFHNWISSLYETIQQPNQHSASSLPSHYEYEQDVIRIERDLNSETEIDTNVIQSHGPAQHEDVPATQDFRDSSTSEMIELHHRGGFGADECTQTESTTSPSSSNLCEPQNAFEDWIFKEPQEIPKKSAKQARDRRAAKEGASSMKNNRDKRERKKLKKENQKRLAKQITTSILSRKSNIMSGLKLNTQQQDEEEFATAVEFCANLCNINNCSNVEYDWEEMDIANDMNSANRSNKQGRINGDHGNLARNVNILTEKLNNSQVGMDNNCGKVDTNLELKRNENMGEIRKKPATAKDDSCRNILDDGCPENEKADESKESAKTSCERVEVTINCESDGNYNKIIEDEYLKVPDDTLLDSENIKCDNLDNIEAISETEAQAMSLKAQTEFLEAQIEFEKPYNIGNILLGSDSEDGVETEANLADSQNREVDVGDSEACMILKKSVESKSIEDSRKSIELIDELSEISPKRDEAERPLQSVICALNNTLTENKKPQESNNSYINNEIFLDLALSDTESEENEANTPKFGFNIINQPRNQSLSEGDESDDPVLVIVEEVSDVNTNKITSEIESSLPITYEATNSQSPEKDPLQQNESNTDISTLLGSSVVDDLLANTSTQKLFSSIWRESANDEAQTVSPRKRDRKRKSEIPVVTFCKRSERLRAKQNESTQLSSDEALSSPTKYTNIIRNSSELSSVNDTCDNASVDFDTSSPRKSPRKTLLHSLTKEQINKQFQRFIELKQRVSKMELDEKATEIKVNELKIESNVNTVYEGLPGDRDPCASVERVSDGTSSSLRCSPIHAITQLVASCTSALPSPEPRELPSSYCPPNISCSNPVPYQKNDAHIDSTDFDTPSSPPPLLSEDVPLTNTKPCREIPLELDMSYYSHDRKSILQYLIYNYSSDIYAIVSGNKNQPKTDKISVQLDKFLNNTRDKVDILASKLAATLHEEIENCEVIASLVIDQISKAPRPEIELGCELADVPSKYLGTHLRLISIVLRHLHYKRPEIAAVILEKIESRLFNFHTTEKLSLNAALNLTQLYLVVIPLQHNSQLNPARLYLAKCLYYHNVLAFPMIYEVLCWYPTTLPHRDEPNYDCSDALITVIQHLLMCMTYNMDSKDLHHRELLSLLRYEYHYEPFKPKALEVLCNLVSKLKSGHLTNLKYAFAIFCKRNTKLVDILLRQQLLPLADDYYKLVQRSDEYDERIVALLESISVVVKPLPLDTDISFYISIFERFLCAVQRPLVQEAAVLAILRLQRFGHNRCFHALAHFKPHYPLQTLTTNVLKTFIHKKPLKYWKDLLKQPLSNQLC